ncbi:MAG: type III polyketide synthase [Methylococcaceae bacterium]|jgi:predicted naringenin-chalcone synthase
MIGNPHIASLAVSVPPYSADQAFAEEFVKRHFSGRLDKRSMHFVHTFFSHPSIRKRHYAIDDPVELVDEDPDRRVARFTERSIELAADAAIRALEQVNLGVKDVSGIVLNTCTGYICPGVSTYLIERLGLPRNIRAYDLVGSGCGGAIPNLQVAESLITSNDGVVLSVSVEICSATLQWDNDLSLILSNALFGDGAAAAVIWHRPQGWELIASASRFVPEQRETIRYVHKRGQLHNQLSLKLPDIVRKAAAGVVTDVLKEQDLSVSEIDHWALHTGGENIINAVSTEIGISDEKIRPTRTILSEFGNMSSPTVWFVMDEIQKNGVKPGDWCVMIAYGAGLSAHAYLLRRA